MIALLKDLIDCNNARFNIINKLRKINNPTYEYEEKESTYHFDTIEDAFEKYVVNAFAFMFDYILKSKHFAITKLDLNTREDKPKIVEMLKDLEVPESNIFQIKYYQIMPKHLVKIDDYIEKFEHELNKLFQLKNYGDDVKILMTRFQVMLDLIIEYIITNKDVQICIKDNDEHSLANNNIFYKINFTINDENYDFEKTDLRQLFIWSCNKLLSDETANTLYRTIIYYQNNHK